MSEMSQSQICVCAHILTQVPDTVRAYTSDKHVLSEELEDPLIASPPESPNNPCPGCGKVY